MDGLLDYVLPRHCLVCGRFAGAQNLCAPCAAELPRAGDACRRCALPLPGNPDATCGACLSAPPPWNRAVTAFAYRYPVRQLVQRFKFNRSLASGEVLAVELSRSLRRSGQHADAIVPVPLHAWRFFTRGYNQADLLARRIGRDLGLRVDAGLLRRGRRTAAQTGLDAVQRRRNVRGAFRVARRRRAPLPQHVALVDDVMTTGATLEACTRALLRAGVRSVSLWVAARAPPP
ncbi:MAG: ComF family protein [Xanthomonadales bacterium]